MSNSRVWCVFLGSCGRICTCGIRPGYGLVRGWLRRSALRWEGHAGPRRSCSGREHVGCTTKLSMRSRFRRYLPARVARCRSRGARSAPANQRGWVRSQCNGRRRPTPSALPSQTRDTHRERPRRHPRAQGPAPSRPPRAPLPASAIARDLELPRSSTYHLLNVLKDEGFVVHLPEQRRYGLVPPRSSSAPPTAAGVAAMDRADGADAARRRDDAQRAPRRAARARRAVRDRGARRTGRAGHRCRRAASRAPDRERAWRCSRRSRRSSCTRCSRAAAS